MSKRCQKIIRSRAQKIFALLPNNEVPSDHEEDLDEGEFENLANDRILLETIDDETLIAQTNDLLKFVGELDDNCHQDEEVASIEDNTRENISPDIPHADNIPVGSSKSKHSKKPKKQNKKQRKLTKKRIKKTIKWRRETFQQKVTLPPNKIILPQERLLPMDYFYTLFDDHVVQLIVEQSNLYYTQITGKIGIFSREDILDFIGILIIMSIVRLPAYIDYWSSELRYDRVANVMPLRKFKLIRRYIHFADISKYSSDRFYRIRELSELIRKNFNKIDHESRFAVDEQIIPYKGKKAGSRRQYLPKKPTKWGFKLYVRAGISGMMYDFIIYNGQETLDGIFFNPKEMTFGINARVVLSLVRAIPSTPLCTFYFDNYFAEPELLMHLRKEYGILSLCTLRMDRTRGADFVSDKMLKASGRGSYDELTNGKMVILKWYDNRSVVLGSTYTGSQPMSTILRYNTESKKKIPIPCPNLIKEYNTHMGGVDLADMAIALYRIKMKGRRWPTSIFAHLLDMCLVNAWLIHRRDFSNTERNKKNKDENKELSLKHFKLQVAEQMLLFGRAKRKSKSRSPTPPLPKKRTNRTPHTTPGVRYDNVGHIPSFTSKGRCRHCEEGQTIFYCEKCSARLCCVPHRNCFQTFHTRKTT